MVSDLFGPVISSYSRAQALADGVLVDVSITAKEAGVKFPCAMTSEAHAQFVEWSEHDTKRKGTCQDEAGRLWDVVWMLRCAAKRSEGDKIDFVLFVVPREGRGILPRRRTLHATIGPGDTMDPVITIALPGQD